jgi:hypothetical protein
VRFLLTGALALFAAPAWAGETACDYEGGVIVAPAMVAGIAGDWIIDTGTPRTTIHETKAQAEGVEGDALTGDVRLAGATVKALPLKVADLDVRTWNLPTSVNGVIGADVLKGFVVDVSYAPCRIRLSPPGGAPAFRGRTLKLGWDGDRPTAPAAASDGVHELRGPFVVATGLNAPVRLADDVAQVPGAPKPDELGPGGVWLAHLPAMAFAGAAGSDIGAGLMPADGDVVGVIGGQVLAHFRLRFDFPAGKLVVNGPR